MKKNLFAEYDNSGIDHSDDTPHLTGKTLAFEGDVVNDWVGPEDRIDYFRVNLSCGGAYDFTLSNLTDAVTLTVWQEQPNGKMKKMKSVSSKSKGGSLVINDLLLDHRNGKVYVSVEAKSYKKGGSSSYSLGFSGEQYTQGDNSDDVPKTTRHVLSYNTTEYDWVGLGDEVDYFQISPDYSGRYNFTLGGAGESAELAVWQEQPNGKMKRLKRVSGKNKAIVIKDLLLDRSGGKIYISVTARNAKKGGNFNYNLIFNGEQFTEGNNSDDTPEKAASQPALSFGSTVENEWVGFGDAVDYFLLDMNYSGRYNFTVTGLANQVKITVWQVGKNGKLKRLKSATSKSKGNSVSVEDLFVDNSKGNVYVSVEATGAKKAKNSNYDLFWHGEEYNQGDPGNNTPNENAARISFGGTLAGQWAGFSDSINYYVAELNCAGSYDFSLYGLEDSLTLTVWQEQPNGKLKKIDSGSSRSKDNVLTLRDVLLDPRNGKVFLSVESKNAKKGGGSGYSLNFGGAEYAQGDNSDDTFQTARVLGRDHTVSNWVGLGDEIDYYALDLDQAGIFNFLVSEAQNQIKLTVWQEQANGKFKSLKSASIKSGSGDIWGLAVDPARGNLFVSVESVNAQRGSNTDYQLVWSANDPMRQAAIV